MSPLPAPPQGARALADGRERTEELVGPSFSGFAVDVVPEEREVVAAVVDAVVSPGFGKIRCIRAQLQRPDGAGLAGTPGAQVPGDGNVGDARFFFEFAQRGRARIFARFDATFHELQSALGMLESQDLPHRGITKHHGTGLVGEGRGGQSATRFQSSSFLANVIPACAGLVEGKHS